MKKTIEIEVFVSPDGKPTCCLNVLEKKFCRFMMTTRFGTQEICNVTNKELFRDDTGEGWVRPCDGCFIWSES